MGSRTLSDYKRNESRFISIGDVSDEFIEHQVQSLYFFAHFFPCNEKSLVPPVKGNASTGR